MIERRNFTPAGRLERILSEATRRRLTAEMIEAAEARLAASDSPLRGLTPRERDEFSVARVMRRLADDNFNPGACYESEVLEEIATRAGKPWDSSRPEIPFEFFARDMTVAGASGSNYLVDSPVAAAVDALWPYSVTTQAGITILPNLTGNTGIPRTTTAQTGYWLSTEATQTTEGQPTLGQLVMTPKTCGAYVEVSRLLALQSDAEPFLRGHLMGVVGKLVDTAVLAGSGSSGQPQGLVNTAGIGTATGTSLNVAGLADLEDDVSAADGQNLQWITTPGVRKILRGRELATGSGAVWAADTVLGHPAHVSTAAPATTMICGDWSRCVLGLWGGITVEINPFAGFQSGVRGMRLLVALDVGFTTPAAFSIATSVT